MIQYGTQINLAQTPTIILPLSYTTNYSITGQEGLVDNAYMHYVGAKDLSGFSMARYGGRNVSTYWWVTIGY